MGPRTEVPPAKARAAGQTEQQSHGTAATKSSDERGDLIAAAGEDFDHVDSEVSQICLPLKTVCRLATCNDGCLGGGACAVLAQNRIVIRGAGVPHVSAGCGRGLMSGPKRGNERIEAGLLR